jgi:hypothetical protein
MFFQTGALFETADDAVDVLEHMRRQAINAVPGRAFGTIHAYLHHRLAPSVHDGYTIHDETGCHSIKEHDLFLELRRDPCFPDFIDEMPRLITDASLCIYRELASTLPAATQEDRVVSRYEVDEQEVRRFLHLLCCQVELAGESIFDSGNHPTLDLELCCQSYVTQSVAIALYLDFLQRRYPAFLVPPTDPSASDKLASGIVRLQSILKKIEDRLRDTQGTPAPANLTAFRLVSSEVVHQISEFTVWLSDIAETWGAHPDEPIAEEYDPVKRSLDSSPWLRVTGIGCSGEREAVDSINCIGTTNLPNVGHGILTFHVQYDLDANGSFYQPVNHSVWCHTPNGDAVPNNITFIPPLQVLGREHPLSVLLELLAVTGNCLQVYAIDLQRRIDWLEAARENDMPLRTILYSNDVKCSKVCFNLFSISEADRLELGDRLTPMAGKYQEIYPVLKTVKYELPRDSGGSSLPPEQLLMEILAEDDDRDDDDNDEVVPPTPTEGRSRTWRTGRPVGTM